MSDYEIVNVKDGSHLDLILDGLNGAINKVAESVSSPETSVAEQVGDASVDLGKWLFTINETLSAGLAEVVKAIREQQLPPPPAQSRGTIMSDYQIPADQADGRVTFNLVGITDSEGNEISDPAQLAALGFEATSSDPAVFEVTLDVDQPDGAKRVGGYHVGAPGQAAVTSNLKQADGDLIATGTDGFTVSTGEATLGSVNAEFEGLTPIV